MKLALVLAGVCLVLVLGQEQQTVLPRSKDYVEAAEPVSAPGKTHPPQADQTQKDSADALGSSENVQADEPADSSGSSAQIQNVEVKDPDAPGKTPLTTSLTDQVHKESADASASSAQTENVQAAAVHQTLLKKPPTHKTQKNSADALGSIENVQSASSAPSQDNPKPPPTYQTQDSYDAAASLADAAGSPAEAAGSLTDAAGSSADAGSSDDAAGSSADATGSSADAAGSSADADASLADAAGSSADAAGSSADAAASLADAAGSSADAAGSSADATGSSAQIENVQAEDSVASAHKPSPTEQTFDVSRSKIPEGPLVRHRRHTCDGNFFLGTNILNFSIRDLCSNSAKYDHGAEWYITVPLVAHSTDGVLYINFLALAVWVETSPTCSFDYMKIAFTHPRFGGTEIKMCPSSFSTSLSLEVTGQTNVKFNFHSDGSVNTDGPMTTTLSLSNYPKYSVDDWPVMQAFPEAH